MKLVICIQHRFSYWVPPDWFVERLRKDFPSIESIHLKSYRELGDQIEDTDILISYSMRAEVFARAKRLRWIHSTATAVHAVLIPEVVRSHVRVTNAREVQGAVVAEHAIGLMYMLAKRLHITRDFQRAKDWSQEKLWDLNPRPRELRGSSLLVIGMGAIGGNVARVGSAIGMHVTGLREHPQRGSRWVERVVGFDSLDAELPKTDFVVLAAPVTEKTKRMLDSVRIAMLKPSAFVINVGRGALLDESALATAIRERKIAGAALDVFDEEPLPPESPLWDIEDIVITPHSAGLSENAWQRQYELLAENIRRFEAHKPLLGLVDKQRGY